MNTRKGIWLDRKEAYIVTLRNGDHHLGIIPSGIDFRIREEGEGKEYTRFGNQYGTKEKAREAKVEHQLKTYYKNIIEVLKEGGEVYIFGPAEAKHELHKAISEQANGNVTISAVESAGKLTENQIIAAVKKHFGV